MTNLLEPTPTVPPPAGEPPPRQPSVVRGLWKVFAAVLVLGAFVSGTFQIVTLLAHEERTERTTYPADGIARLEVDNSDGSVTVVGTETDEIVVTARISDGLRSTGESQGVVGGVLELRGTCPNFGSDWCRVTYEVQIPRDLDVTIDAADGSIDVRGVAGDVQVDSDNGSVDLDALSGVVTAAADNGRVEGHGLRSGQVTADSDNGRVTLTFTAPPTTVVATSRNGSIEVVVPDDGEAYRLVMDADNGSQNADIPTNPAGARSITVRSENGSVTVRTPAPG
jgi:hypothetical protein